MSTQVADPEATQKKPFDLADVSIRIAFDPRSKKESGLKAVWNGRQIGIIDFEDFDRNTWTGVDFHVTYIKILPKYQSKGVGRLLLEAVKAQISEHTTRVAFTCMTSRGVARLVERIFGTLYDYDYHNYQKTNELRLPFHWDSMEELSPQADLWRSRGPNGFAEWPMRSSEA
jgi:GNAT superfamily N-acetyltransferase